MKEYSKEYLIDRNRELRTFHEMMNQDAREILEKALKSNDVNIVSTYASAMLNVCANLLLHTVGKDRMYESFMLAAMGPNVVCAVADAQRAMEKAVNKRD